MSYYLFRDGESLHSYGSTGCIHFVWQNAGRIATGRTVTDDDVREWLTATEKGRWFAEKGYRLVHLSSYAGPCLVAPIRRTGPNALEVSGKAYQYQAVKRDGRYTWPDLHVTFRVIHDGQDLGEHELKHWSTKDSILCFLEHEDEIVRQTADTDPPSSRTSSPLRS